MSRLAVLATGLGKTFVAGQVAKAATISAAGPGYQTPTLAQAKARILAMLEDK